MGNRADLQSMLESIVGEDRVYFQPPETRRMEYPCIVYFLNNRVPTYANDNPYCINKSYQITYISKNPDDNVPEVLSKLPKTRFNRRYIADKLYHDVFTIFY